MFLARLGWQTHTAMLSFLGLDGVSLILGQPSLEPQSSQFPPPEKLRLQTWPIMPTSLWTSDE
jgi:hypothetical protein